MANSDTIMAWDVTVCTVVDTYQHFGENCCPQFCEGLSYMSVPIHEITPIHQTKPQ